jgi:gluconate 2-dehydrogenase alpha chain
VRPERDVVIVGMGASGGLLASLLTDAGLEVVGLEAGERHGVDEFTLEDAGQLTRSELGAAKVNHEIPTVRSSREEQAAPASATYGLLIMNGVGGSKLHSTNISWRLLPWNLQAYSGTVARYGAGAIPEGSTLVDWPLTYGELAPYYDRIEGRYAIAGQAGNVRGELDARGNPFEGERSGPYPSPPLRSSGWTRLADGAARELGWHPFPVPASIRSTGAGSSTDCGYCTWNGCHVDAKMLPSSVGLPEALASGRLELLTGARATEILVDGDGRATGVAFVHEGRREVQRARLVVLATYTYQNTRLLLLSRSKAFPDGLANNAGQVGRHFMTHSFVMGLGEFPGKRMNAWSGTASQATAVDDFDGDNFDHSGLGFLGGSVLMACMELRLAMAARMTPPGLPRWGDEYKRWLAERFRSIAWAYTLPDVLPHEDNFLDLDPAARDRHGVPVVRVTYGFKESDRRQVAYLKDRLGEWFAAAGAARSWTTDGGPAPVSTHAYGGTRMGTDPSTSVVDAWGLAHEVPGLAVIGASCFPTSGGVNPTETVEALTWRSADHVLANWAAVTE